MLGVDVSSDTWSISLNPSPYTETSSGYGELNFPERYNDAHLPTDAVSIWRFKIHWIYNMKHILYSFYVL